MRWTTLIALILAVPVSGGESVKDKELEWARDIAQEFLDAVFDRDQPEYNAVGLLSPELASIHSRGEILNSPINALYAQYSGAKITSSAISPNRAEAIFTGTLINKDGSEDQAFRIRVASEAGGRWSIRHVSVRKKPAKNKK